jgi:hypothetical protein
MIVKILMMLAETGVMHKDGTFSLLRGGIDKVAGPKLPIVLSGAVAVRFSVEPSEKGPHKWRLVVVDIDGKRIAPDIEGSFKGPDEGGAASILMHFSLSFPRTGLFSFQVSADDLVRDDWPVHVELTQPELPKPQ